VSSPSVSSTRKGPTARPIAAGAPRRRAHGRWWPLLASAVLIVVLMAPMVFTGSTFGGDWPTHLWLIQMQADNISHLGHPSLFFQSGLGGFEPWYAFYGGTLYSITAAGAVLSGGHTLATYVLSFALTMAMAFGGFTWIGRQAGLRGWTALVAGFAFLTSAYYITDVYARGAWAETVATSAVPLLVAGAIALLRADSWRPLPVLTFVFAVVMFSGSHNITLLYGTCFCVLLCVTVGVAVGPDTVPPVRRILAVAGLGLLAVGINLWFLLPDVMYGAKTTIGHSFSKPPEITGGMPLGPLLDPVRHSSIVGFPTFDLQLPTLVLAWSAVVLAICWGGMSRVWRRLAVAMAVCGLVFLAPILFPALWRHVPRLFWSIQFPYRLLSYVDYCVVALLIIAVVALARRTRTVSTIAVVLLGLLCAGWELSQAVKQEWNGPSSLTSRAEIFPGGAKVPSFWTRFVTYHQYQDNSLPTVSATIGEIPGVTGYNGEGENVMSVPAAKELQSSYTVTFTPPESGTINTNVLTGPYLVGVKGAKIVGRSPNQNMVLQVVKNPSGPTVVTFTTSGTWPVVLGRWATYLSIPALLVLLAVLVFRRSPRRSGRSPTAPPAQAGS
jgi:hypothetical protein